MKYLLDSEVHTFAFSVAANAILSFIPFIVLLYTIAQSVFHSNAMVDAVSQMVFYFFPSNQDFITKNLMIEAPRHGVQVFSLVMILISCTGIFLPLEVALNQAWGVTKSRNYLMNQLVAFGLAILMVVLGLTSVLLSRGPAPGTGVPVFPSHREFRLQRNQLSLAGALHRSGLHPVLLRDLLAAAQPAGAVAAGAARIDRGGADLAFLQVCIL